MKKSRFTFQNRNLKAMMLIAFLFAGNISFAQTTQAEPVKATEPETELGEYPIDPLIVPTDLKKHAMEQKALIKSIPVKENAQKKMHCLRHEYHSF